MYDEEQLNQHKDVPEFSSSGFEENVLFSRNEVEGSLIDDAKLTELENWKRNHIYEEVSYSTQKYISMRWVFTEKYVDGKKVVKVRMVATGYITSGLSYLQQGIS